MKKKTKVVLSGDTISINEYLEKKKIEVPLYDPQTGEPNPYYEELTGKKNPLLNTKMLNPQVKEYKLKNRFLVHLPKEFGIYPWEVKFMDRPTIILKPKKFLGLTYGYKKIYFPLLIEINDTIENNNKTLLNFLENKIKFSFYIEELDPTGIIINKFDFYDCIIDLLNLGNLDYKSDKINNITLSINIGGFEIK